MSNIGYHVTNATNPHILHIEAQYEFSDLMDLIKIDLGASNVFYSARFFNDNTALQRFFYSSRCNKKLIDFIQKNECLLYSFFKNNPLSNLPNDGRDIENTFPDAQLFFEGINQYSDKSKNSLICPIAFSSNCNAVFYASFPGDTPSNWNDFKKLVMSNLLLFSHLFHDKVINDNSIKNVCCHDILTKREKECVYWAGLGYTNVETSKRLNISHNTVRMYLDSARIKLDCRNKAQLIATCVKQGLVL